MPEVDAVLGTKGKNYKEIFQKFQECVLQYVVANLQEMSRSSATHKKMEYVDLSSNEPISPT